MTRLPTYLTAAALFAAIGLGATPAFAQDAGTGATPFAATALGDDALATVAGREDTRQAALANLNAGVSNNSVGANATTGDAKISDNAFQNMSGLSILNVNTGNNVAINAAMNVTISIAPGQ